MKEIRSEYAGMRNMKKIYKMIFSFGLIFVLVLAVPGGLNNVYAAPLEDCDLDGFDDATGVPVPWPGYDETKGDTPDGPAGSKKPATTPDSSDSTASGNSNSETPGKTGEDSDKTDSTKSGNANDANSGKTDNTKSENTDKVNTDKTSNSNSGKTNSTVQDKTDKAGSGKTSSKTNSTAAGKTGKEESGKTDSKAQENTDKTESGKAGSTAQDETDKEESGKTGSTVQSNTDKTESGKAGSTAQDNTDRTEPGKTSSTGSGKTKVSGADSTGGPVSGEKNNQETSQYENEQVKVNSDNGSTENSDTSAEEIEAVLNTKGSLEITEAAGSIIHAGSSVIISGSGFAGDIDNLEIEIQSEPRQLGIARSSENGSFEAKLNIPEDLKAGVHHIVVLYQGKEITRQQIEVGPKAADSFFQALSVGFTKDNEGLVPGLLILLGLFVSGIGVLGVNVFIRPRRNKS